MRDDSAWFFFFFFDHFVAHCKNQWSTVVKLMSFMGG